MMYEVKDVKPLEEYKLLVTFNTGEKKIKDIKPLFTKGVFKALQNKTFFNSVRVDSGAITWGYDIDAIDLCPDNTFQTSIPVE